MSLSNRDNFGTSLWLSIGKLSVTYFLLPARAWELDLGALLAAEVVPRLCGALLWDLAPIAAERSQQCR